MSTLTDPLDPGCALAASDPAVFGGVEAGGTKWVCARAPAQPISPRPSADRPDSGEGALSGYIELAREVGNIDHFIVPPALSDRAGVLGALHLAMAAHPGLAK